MVNDIVINGIYQHYKGQRYLVRNVARHSETLEWLVFYECLYENPEGRFWVRPKEMFLESVESNGEQVPRFKFLAAT